MRAVSDAAAQRAIPPRLRDTCVRLAMEGTVELRRGAILYSVRGCGFDREGVLRALGSAAPLMVLGMLEGRKESPCTIDGTSVEGAGVSAARARAHVARG